MGSRLVAETLHWANGRDDYGKDFLYHVILAAPNLYVNRYASTTASMSSLSKNVTLYASDNDQALACSHFVHMEATGRAGRRRYLSTSSCGHG
jgi:esterase/lipase superfamily enzyme